MSDTYYNPLDLAELSSTPANPASGFRRIYSKADGKLYQKNSVGVESSLDSLLANTSASPVAGGTTTIDLSITNDFSIVMPSGNITIALSNATNARRFIISITQDSIGGRTVTWFTTIKWANGIIPTLTTTSNKRDVFGFIVTSTGQYDGFVIGLNI